MRLTDGIESLETSHRHAVLSINLCYFHQLDVVEPRENKEVTQVEYETKMEFRVSTMNGREKGDGHILYLSFDLRFSLLNCLH